MSVASPVEEDKVAEAPAFRDPVTDGAADPCVVFNRQEKVWYMFYTQRRANTESCDVAYCYGNKIGVACSDDNGRSWYRSDDFDHWTRQEGRILDTRSNRRDDGPSGSHGDVVVVGDRAWVFYFTHPGRKRHPDANHDANDNIPYEHRRSSIQVAELEITPEGALQVKDRNAGVRIYLPNDCK